MVRTERMYNYLINKTAPPHPSVGVSLSPSIGGDGKSTVTTVLKLSIFVCDNGLRAGVRSPGFGLIVKKECHYFNRYEKQSQTREVLRRRRMLLPSCYGDNNPCWIGRLRENFDPSVLRTSPPPPSSFGHFPQMKTTFAHRVLRKRNNQHAVGI